MPKTYYPIFVVLEGVLAQPSSPDRDLPDPVRGAQKFLARCIEIGRVTILARRIGQASSAPDKVFQHKKVRRWLAFHKFPDCRVGYEFPRAGEGVIIGSEALSCRPLQRDNGEFLPEFAYDDTVFSLEKLVGLEDVEA